MCRCRGSGSGLELERGNRSTQKKHETRRRCSQTCISHMHERPDGLLSAHSFIKRPSMVSASGWLCFCVRCKEVSSSWSVIPPKQEHSSITGTSDSCMLLIRMFGCFVRIPLLPSLIFRPLEVKFTSLSHPGAGQISRPGLIWLTALWRLGSACSCVGSTRPRHWSYFWFLLYNLICCCSLLLLSGTDWVCQEPGAFHAASRLQEKEKVKHASAPLDPNSNPGSMWR